MTSAPRACGTLIMYKSLDARGSCFPVKFCVNYEYFWRGLSGPDSSAPLIGVVHHLINTQTTLKLVNVSLKNFIIKFCEDTFLLYSLFSVK